MILVGWRRGDKAPDTEDYNRCWSEYYDRETSMDTPINFNNTSRLWIEFFELRRMEVLTDILRRYLNDDMSIADIGCGDSVIMNIVEDLGVDVNLTGLDISDVSIEHNMERWPDQEWIIGSAIHPDLEAGSFDMVHAGELIEHLDDESRIPSLLEWCNLVNEDGYIVITTPTPSMKIPYGQHLGFVNEGDVKKAFKKYQIKMVEVRGIGFFLPIHGRMVLSIKNVILRNRIYTWLLRSTYSFPIIADQIIYVGHRKV